MALFRRPSRSAFWETSCVSIRVCAVKTRFLSPVFQAKDLGKRRDTQTSRKIDLTYF